MIRGTLYVDTLNAMKRWQIDGYHCFRHYYPTSAVSASVCHAAVFRLVRGIAHLKNLHI